MPAMRLAVLAVLLVLAGLALPPAAGARTVWLCKPGLKADPCSPRLDTTRFSPAGERVGTHRVRRARPRRIDCFYVYPTVSGQPAPVATRAIDPELRSIALYQAARYSRDCRIFAPVYRQITLQGLFSGGLTAAMVERTYADVRDAWREYLQRHNRRRGIVLIGHSQGTFWLRRLIAEEIDGERRMRRRLVSALLLGGQVIVREGQDAGGDFERVRACRSARQVGCVVAFSTFNGPVPADARFGRLGGGVEILCTNPAALGGGVGLLDPIAPRAPFAPGTAIAAAVDAVGFPRPQSPSPWLAFPDAYSARCSSEDGASVLQITPRAGAPVLRPSPDPTWGLHTTDANIALGNLARLVRRQAVAYARAR
jgi:hypothetical protein